MLSLTLLHLLQLEAASCGYRRGQPVLTGVTLCVEQVRRWLSLVLRSKHSPC